MRPLGWRFNGSQASRRSTSASDCRQPIRMLLAAVASRATCTGEPRRQRCAMGSGTPPPNLKRPMRVPTRCQVIARPCGNWAFCAGTGHVRRCGPGGEGRREDFEAVSKRNPLECGPATRDARRDRAQARSARQTVELLTSASPYERAYPEAVYLRGWLTWVCMKARAAAEFEKILDHKGASWGSAWQHPIGDSFTRFPTWPGARLRTRGRPGESRKSLSGFPHLWKDADPDVPILKQAKAEYARLH